MSTPTTSSQTLIGYLGKDRIERYTEARTYTVMVPVRIPTKPATHSDAKPATHSEARRPLRSERSDDQGSWLVEVAALATCSLRFCHLLFSSFSDLAVAAVRSCGNPGGGGRAARISKGCGKVRGWMGGGLDLPRFDGQFRAWV
jgi:hypothetical protein